MAGGVEVASYQRIEPGSYNVAVGTWPETVQSTDIDPNAVAKNIVGKFNQALETNDHKALAALFHEDGFWRDHLANTWDLRTMKGRDKIYEFANEHCRTQKIATDDESAFKAPHVGPLDGIGNVKGVEFFITFETTIGNGQGVVRLVEKGSEWLIFNLFLALKELKGFEEPLRQRRVTGVAHGTNKDRKLWQNKRAEDKNFTNSEPVVMIVGAGQAGLTAAARLKMLDVATLVIDRNDRIGDNWRQRYAELTLHDPVWFDHMPYVSFPAHWPVFTPKDKLAEWFEAYASTLELNIWTKTTVESSSYDDGKKEWTVTLVTKKSDGSTEKRTVHPHHIIQATGHSGKKNFPQIKGMEVFEGDTLCHSADFPGAKENGQGKSAVVVGACNSGHDICQSYYEQGYDVTMVQRSSTCVVSSEAILEVGLKGLYDETGPPVDDADMWLYAYPGETFKALQGIISGIQGQVDAKTLEGLKKAGFQVDNGPDNTGLFMKYWQRGGGYYIDVGASQSIIDGKIKVKSGLEITEILPRGLRFEDGSELQADELIFATGYQNMRTEAQHIFGDDVFNRVQSVWGLNEEGEFRTIWQKTGHPGFWFTGGNLALCRYFSKVLALQIKGLEEGLYQYDGK